ncbi:hypothetical protein JWG42_15030 [Desulfoprunum benzoelyticum]|uniref:Uncharacterized protein n=1 Tax=Desulfoprunum benzoelyticum TaxID=1506996 RepID=A0A840V6T6_9BACT|nr:hypothetical protein [Desulfoprunum benzoelyticum]MBB5349459.1 hypothetical protein [Desulfoprunum benzoelyticum]MBM9531472.1 hypothetical protein [Desulfoprunum benzoelyticum]
MVGDDRLLLIPQRREVDGDGGFIPSVKYIRRREATIFHGGACPSRLPGEDQQGTGNMMDRKHKRWHATGSVRANRLSADDPGRGGGRLCAAP